MTLRQQHAGEPLAPIVVMALRAAQIELAEPLAKQLATGIDEGLELLVARFRDRHAARLSPDIGGERQQVAALEWQRRRLLMLSTAQIYALFEIDRAVARRAKRRVARRDALHAGRRVVVAIGAGAVGGAGLLVPQCLAVEHPQSRWI